MERARQFKVLLSDDEWEKLVDVAEFEDTSLSDVIRNFISRRHEEVSRPDGRDLLAVADALAELARKTRALASRRKASR